jgi:signal recognition particle GTPase
VTTTITEQLTDMHRDIDAEKFTLKTYLAERLGSDDQILGRLPGIVSQIVTEPEVSEDEKSIEQWCKAIVSYRTAEMKARVDAVLNEQKAALQAELDDLHSEIASIAEMAVEHEIRKPVADVKERKDRERVQARSAWLKYVGLPTILLWSVLMTTGVVYTRVHGQALGYRR